MFLEGTNYTERCIVQIKDGVSWADVGYMKLEVGQEKLGTEAENGRVGRCSNCYRVLLNLYAIYARYGTINILLPFTDLLRNARPYVARPASFSSHEIKYPSFLGVT